MRSATHLHLDQKKLKVVDKRVLCGLLTSVPQNIVKKYSNSCIKYSITQDIVNVCCFMAILSLKYALFLKSNYSYSLLQRCKCLQGPYKQ